MKCPRDGAVIERASSGHIPFYMCAECGGVWIENSDVADACNSDAFTEPSAERPERPEPDGDIECPADGEKMYQIDYLGVLVDVCPRCLGVWFDYRELSRIRGKHLAEQVKGRTQGDLGADLNRAIEADPRLGPARKAIRGNEGRIVNRNSVIGCLFGAFISPLILIGGCYVIVRGQLSGMTGTGFPPPNVPTMETVSLDWEVHALDGEKINLAKSFEGKAVFLNFWATWCPPCVAEMPSIDALYGRCGDRVGFACVTSEGRETVQDFLKTKRHSLPVYLIRGEPPVAFRTNGIPATFVISKERKVVLRHVGGADWADETVAQFIESLAVSKDGDGTHLGGR